MPALIRDKTTPITVDGTNVIYIRSGVTAGMQARLADGLRLRQNGKGVELGVGEGEALMLLLRETVADWEGPDFEGEDGRKIPCTPYMIEQLDPNDELFGKVREEVMALYERMTKGSSPNSPKSKRTTRSTSRQ